MSKTSIPTAQEKLDYHTKTCKGTARTAMIEFAKLHVKAALEAAAGSVEFDRKVLIRQSILQSYPESNIR